MGRTQRNRGQLATGQRFKLNAGAYSIRATSEAAYARRRDVGNVRNRAPSCNRDLHFHRGCVGSSLISHPSVTQPGPWIHFTGWPLPLRLPSPTQRCGFAHSITSSARTSSEGGTVRPSALAVFMSQAARNRSGRGFGKVRLTENPSAAKAPLCARRT